MQNKELLHINYEKAILSTKYSKLMSDAKGIGSGSTELDSSINEFIINCFATLLQCRIKDIKTSKLHRHVQTRKFIYYILYDVVGLTYRNIAELWNIDFSNIGRHIKEVRLYMEKKHHNITQKEIYVIKAVIQTTREIFIPYGR